MTTLLFSVLADQFEQLLYGLGLGDVLLNTFLGLVEGDLTSAGTDIAVVGIGHLARTVHNTAHDTDLQPIFKPTRSFVAALILAMVS